MSGRPTTTAVETTRTQQRRVQYVRAVGCGNDNDAVIHFKTVHLDQQLVESLLTLVMTTAHAGATMATDRVDFVNEDDAWRVFLGLLEHVANAARTNTHEHLDEVGTGDREERNLGFAGNGLGDQRFTGTRRADHQHAARNPTARALELARIAEEFDQLAHFFLGFVATGNVSGVVLT